MNPLAKILNARRSAEEQARKFTDDFEAEIEAIRNRIRSVESEIERTRCAPVDTAQIKARAASLVDEVLRGARSIHGLVDILSLPNASFVKNTASFSTNDAYGGATRLSAFQLAAIVNRDALIDGLVRESEAAGKDNGAALTDAKRQATLMQLEAELGQLNTAEEMMLRGLEATGAKLPRRHDADIEFICADDESLMRLAGAGA